MNNQQNNSFQGNTWGSQEPQSFENAFIFSMASSLRFISEPIGNFIAETFPAPPSPSCKIPTSKTYCENLFPNETCCPNK